MQGPWGRKPWPEASGGRGRGQGALAPAEVHTGPWAVTSAGAQRAFQERAQLSHIWRGRGGAAIYSKSSRGECQVLFQVLTEQQRPKQTRIRPQELSLQQGSRDTLARVGASQGAAECTARGLGPREGSGVANREGQGGGVHHRGGHHHSQSRFLQALAAELKTQAQLTPAQCGEHHTGKGHTCIGGTFTRGFDGCGEVLREGNEDGRAQCGNREACPHAIRKGEGRAAQWEGEGRSREPWTQIRVPSPLTLPSRASDSGLSQETVRLLVRKTRSLFLTHSVHSLHG